MSLLKTLGIDKYTTKFKEWIASKYVAKNNIKTINNESLIGEGNIEISGGSSAIPDWNAREGEAGYIKNKPLTIPNDNIEYYTAVEFIESEEPTEDGYRFVSIRPIGSLTDEDSLIVKSFYSDPSALYKDDIYHFTFKEHIGIYEFTFDSVKVVLNFDGDTIEFRTNDDNTSRGEYFYRFTDSDVIYKIKNCYIPDTIARKSDINNITTKNITTDFGITIVDLLGDYEDYYTFWDYVTQGYNTINYNDDENTIAFPISMRENSEITGSSIYIPYPDGQIEIYYADGSGLGGKIIKTFVDPIVYKYLLNPIQVYDGATIPQDVLTADGKLKYLYPGMYRVSRDNLIIDISSISPTIIFTRYINDGLVTNYHVYFAEPDSVWLLVEDEEA